MKYSIILPVKNGGEYLKKCVSSVLAQKLQDFNFIILDNCSTDGSREWLESLQNEKIIIYPSSTPLTIEENWARITQIPKNGFITLIGHDDILYPDFLENINLLIEQYPQAGLYHTHFNFIDAKGKIIRPSKPMVNFFSGEDLLRGFLTQSVDSMGTGYVMRSKDYDAIEGIPVKYPSLLFADFEIWLQIAGKGGMAVAKQTSFSFRVHKSTTGNSSDSKLHDALKIFVNFLALEKKINAQKAAIISENAAEFLLFYCKGFCHRLLRTENEKRNGISVAGFIKETKKMADILGVTANYQPEKISTIKVALIIDRSKFLRNAFLFFKKLFPKPILK